MVTMFKSGTHLLGLSMSHEARSKLLPVYQELCRKIHNPALGLLDKEIKNICHGLRIIKTRTLMSLVQKVKTSHIARKRMAKIKASLFWFLHKTDFLLLHCTHWCNVLYEWSNAQKRQWSWKFAVFVSGFARTGQPAYNGIKDVYSHNECQSSAAFSELDAKIPGVSFRENGKVRKKGAIYLGRVIDEENNIFYNKERWLFNTILLIINISRHWILTPELWKFISQWPYLLLSKFSRDTGKIALRNIINNKSVLEFDFLFSKISKARNDICHGHEDECITDSERSEIDSRCKELTEMIGKKVTDSQIARWTHLSSLIIMLLTLELLLTWIYLSNGIILC